VFAGDQLQAIPVSETPATLEGEVEALRIVSAHALVDLRVRLLDEAGRLVPAKDEAHVGKGTRYELHPSQPLTPGTVYRVAVDGQEGSNPVDVAAISFAPVTIAFRTAGEKPAPPPPQQKKRASRHRR
jgi:hypothetical protein